MTINYKGKIAYKMRSTHPNYDCVIGGYKPGDVITFSDTYHINPDGFYGEDHILSYIKNDLLVVAGGGYVARNIYDVEFTIERM